MGSREKRNKRGILFAKYSFVEQKQSPMAFLWKGCPKYLTNVARKHLYQHLHLLHIILLKGVSFWEKVHFNIHFSISTFYFLKWIYEIAYELMHTTIRNSHAFLADAWTISSNCSRLLKTLLLLCFLKFPSHLYQKRERRMWLSSGSFLLLKILVIPSS